MQYRPRSNGSRNITDKTYTFKEIKRAVGIEPIRSLFYFNGYNYKSLYTAFDADS